LKSTPITVLLLLLLLLNLPGLLATILAKKIRAKLAQKVLICTLLQHRSIFQSLTRYTYIYIYI